MRHETPTALKTYHSSRSPVRDLNPGPPKYEGIGYLSLGRDVLCLNIKILIILTL
jgi:hypothetical protein